MAKSPIILHVLLVVGVVAVSVLGSEGRATSLGPADAELHDLERATMLDPSTTNVLQLAELYLEHEQPGLAEGLLARYAPASTDPSVVFVKSRVALAQGRADEALFLARVVSQACEEPESGCSASLMAKTLHGIGALEAFEAAGIVDPNRNPSESRALVAQASRGVRIEL